MSSLLDAICGPTGEPEEALPDVLFVRGIPYRNTAAKFWMLLFREVSRRFHGITKLEFSTFREGELTAEQLYPDVELQHYLETLSNVDTHKLFMQTLTELEMYGTPHPVHISISLDGKHICSAELPSEYVDSEIFTYLIVWMLQWAELPSFMWNQTLVSGEFTASGKDDKEKYHIHFELQNTDLSEELYRIMFCVEIEPQTSP